MLCAVQQICIWKCRALQDCGLYTASAGVEANIELLFTAGYLESVVIASCFGL